MSVPITFDGGALHGNKAMTRDLPAEFVFFVQRDRAVLIYAKKNEVEYVFNVKRSRAATKNYDDLFKRRKVYKIDFTG